MFCKWCGKKISNIGSPCPSCGKDQDPLENGNGFWDLCSKEVAVQPVSAETPVETTAKESGAEKTSKKNKNSRSSEVHKPTKKLWVGAWAVTVALLLIAIIVIVIGVGKIDFCLSEISNLRSSVYSTNTLVTSGFAKLEEYYLSEEAETQPTEETEPVTDENTSIDLDNLIEENTLLMDDEALNIEIYTNESTTAKFIYIAGGEMLENENAKVFWQKSIDQGETWETICEDASYIFVGANETDAYRIICVVVGGSEEAVNLYCDVAIELEENAEPQSDDIETDVCLSTEDITIPTGSEDGSVG